MLDAPPTSLSADVARLLSLLEKATPGPWYVDHHDDSHCMNAYSIRTDKKSIDLDGGGDVEQFAGCVAMTLLQEPRYICHSDSRHAENAALIVALRNLAPALLARLADLEARASGGATLREVEISKPCAPVRMVRVTSEPPGAASSTSIHTMREALAFYADSANYEQSHGNCGGSEGDESHSQDCGWPEVLRDEGRKARAALSIPAKDEQVSP